MNDEKISIELTEYEYIKNVVENVIDDDDIMELCMKSSVMLLAIPVISKAIWDKMIEYSRMKIVAGMIMNSKED